MFQVRPYPDFSWSVSRQRKLEERPRAYYFHYYGSHNGWLPEAPPPAKQAYRLKQLTSIDALLGQEMDRRALEIEAAARAGAPLPMAEELEERTRRALREAYRSSMRRREEFEARPKSAVMLRSFYIDGREPLEQEVSRVQMRPPACIRNLLDAPDWERVRTSGQSGRVELDEFMTFLLEGVTVFAMADFAYVYDDRLCVIDWKTGEPDPGHEVQPLLSAYCLRQNRPELRRYSVEPVVFYLSSGERRTVPLPPDLDQYVVDIALPGVRAMQSYLQEPAVNAPLDVTEFPRRESGLCPSCNFRPLCERGV